MKNMMLTVVLLSATSVTSAGNTTSSDVHEVCGNYSEVVEVMAESKYLGIPMRKVMNAVPDEPLLRQAVVKAYALPDFSTKKYQKRATRNLSNDEYANCLAVYGNE